LTSIFVLESMILTPLALTRKLASRKISSK
jgi:hypothetical protein